MRIRLICIILAISVMASLPAAAVSTDDASNIQAIEEISSVVPVDAVNAASPEQMQATLLLYKDTLGIADAYERYILMPAMQSVINENMSKKTFIDGAEIKTYFERLINDISEYGKMQITTKFVIGEEDITVSVATDRQNEKLILTVFKPSEQEYSMADITEQNAEAIIGFVYQDYTDENGNHSFTFRMPEESPAGEYVIKVSCNGMSAMIEDLRTSSFYYADELEMERAREAVNKATVDTIEQAISHPCFNFDLGEIYKNNKEEINKAIIDLRDNQGAFKSADEIYRAFYTAQVIAGLKNRSIALADMKLAAEKANIIYPENYDKYAEYTSEIIENNFPQKWSVESIEELLRLSYALAALNNGTREEASEILSAYADELRLTGTSEYKEYVALGSNTNEIDAKITNKNYLKASEVLSALSTALSERVYEEDVTRPSGGSGGHSPSSGGMVVISPTTVGDTAVAPQTVEYENVFKDMDSAEWAKISVNYLASVGVLNGDGSGNYYPNHNMTRAEFVKMLVMAFKLYDEEADSNFADSTDEDWHYRYVSSAYHAGIASGITEDTFGVNDLITRQQAAVMIDRANNQAEKSIREYQAFADENEIAEYAVESVRRLYCAGIINGMDRENFAPSQSLTRAQAAVMIYNTIKA